MMKNIMLIVEAEFCEFNVFGTGKSSSPIVYHTVQKYGKGFEQLYNPDFAVMSEDV